MTNNMQLRFMNVGYGEAILLCCPTADGKTFTMLIDGGSDEDAEFLGHPNRIRSAQQLKALGIKRLDVVLNTHIHEDHTCGLPQIINEVEVGEYWCCPLPEGFEDLGELNLDLSGHPSGVKFQCALNAQQEMLRALKKRGVPVRQLLINSKLPEYCQNLSIDVLGPSLDETEMMLALLASIYAQQDEAEKKRLLLKADSIMNNHSVILKLTYNKTQILLCGDTNAQGFGYIKPELLRADIFKLGHHGQLDSATPETVKLISPRALAICASSDRRYGSMSPDVLSMFKEYNPNTLFLLSDTPDLPPWTNGVPEHFAAELLIDAEGQISLKYISE
ncbi:MBL fold metallo-hydrolase [Eubacteriales bacterium OttesenSCG-928-K08]|nr:MBL fold metallo-hydrolase [Eubacteriales bacterium OttesenSCG-928-K08]